MCTSSSSDLALPSGTSHIRRRPRSVFQTVFKVDGWRSWFGSRGQPRIIRPDLAVFDGWWENRTCSIVILPGKHLCRSFAHARSTWSRMFWRGYLTFFINPLFFLFFAFQVAYSLLMPANMSAWEKSSEFQLGFILRGGIPLLLNMHSFLGTAGIPTNRYSFILCRNFSYFFESCFLYQIGVLSEYLATF